MILLVVRYNSNGSLDTSFDTDGKVTTPIGSSDDDAYAIAIQSDGKIVVAGDSHNGTNYDFAVVRYNTNGSLDTSFDTDGKVTTPIGSSDDNAMAIAIQSDGKIVVAGDSYNGTNYDFAVVRYNTDGSLDTSFDGDGKVTTNIASSNDFVRAITLQSDGKIVVAGYSNISGNNDFVIVRYNSNGSLDTSFDTDGITITNIASNNELPKAITLQSDGKIVVAGDSNISGNNDFVIVRYNSNGSLDTSFDTDGKVITNISGTSNDVANAIAIQSDGKIVVAGYSNISGNIDFTVLRYK